MGGCRKAARFRFIALGGWRRKGSEDAGEQNGDDHEQGMQEAAGVPDGMRSLVVDRRPAKATTYGERGSGDLFGGRWGSTSGLGFCGSAHFGGL